jgi:large exoprotein involved in heme utilization and adhesion
MNEGTISAETSGLNDAGSITVNAGTFTMRNGSSISSSSINTASNAGSAGQITIQGSTGSGGAAASVSLDNSALSTTVKGGSAANTPASIAITADVLSLTNGAEITANTSGPAPAGNISLNVDTLTASTSTVSSASTKFFASNAGSSGQITVQGLSGPGSAASTVSLDSSTISTTINGGSPTTTPGDISITSGTLSLQNGSQITAATLFGGAPGGNIVLTAESASINNGKIDASTFFGDGKGGNIVLNANIVDLNSSTISSSSQASSAGGGTITLEGLNGAGNRAQTITLSSGSEISATTTSSGSGGMINVNAVDLHLKDGSAVDTSTRGSGAAGNIMIDAKTVVLSGGAHISADTSGTGQGGLVSIQATDSLVVTGSNAAGHSTNISTETALFGDAGEVRLSAPTIIISEGAVVEAQSDGVTGKAGAITLQAGQLNVINGGFITSSTLSAGAGGTVNITATEQMTIAGSNQKGSSQVAAATGASGSAGQVIITTPLLQVDGGVIKTNTAADGKAGSVNINAGSLALTNGAQIVSLASKDPTTGKISPGDAGSVTINVSGLLSSQGSTISSSANSGAGGNVTITTGNLQLTGDSTVSAQSTGAKDAGSIKLASGSDILLQNSTVTTNAAQASGGNIKLTAPGSVTLDNGKVTSSVNGPAGSNGGNISIDPVFVILRNGSQVLAQANEGAGGNILINATGAVLAEAGTLIDASAASGINGSINIQAPIRALSGAIAPLPQAFAKITNLYRQHCAAQKGGQFSSFIQGTRDGLPPVPGDYMSSPLTFDPAMSQHPPSNSSAQSVTAAQLGLVTGGTTKEEEFSISSGCRS